MKTAMKKVLSLSLVLVLLLSIFPMTALATETAGDIAPADVGGMLPGPNDQGFEIYDPDAEPAIDGEPGDDIAAANIGDMLPDRDDQDFPIYEGNTLGGRPDREEGKDNNHHHKPTATSLTVKFYVDNALAETATHNAAASVLQLIQACCTVDDKVTLEYNGARVDNTPYDLGDVVELGETVHIYLYTKAPVVEPTPDTNPKTCAKCGAKVENEMCTRCSLNEVDCVCANCKECGAPKDAEHREDCSKHPDYNKREMTNITLNYNYRGAPRNGSFEAKKGALLKDVIASIPAPTRDGHLFSHWTLDAEGYDSIKTEHVTNGMTIFAQWDDDLAIGGKYTIRVNLNYDHKMGEPLTNIKRGTKMGDVLDYVTEPTRWNHKFMGWYWDRECKDAVKDSDKIYKNDEIFAKWEYRKNTNDIMLKIYLNGEAKSAAKIVDLYDYAKDGRITKDEVDNIVKKYYKAKSSNDDMDIEGLFTVDTWHNGKYSMRNAEKSIRVEHRDETIIYVMVRDAKAITSSSADTTNPKTGDMIMTSVIVMGASVSALAVLFYLNKKRAY